MYVYHTEILPNIHEEKTNQKHLWVQDLYTLSFDIIITVHAILCLKKWYI